MATDGLTLTAQGGFGSGGLNPSNFSLGDASGQLAQAFPDLAGGAMSRFVGAGMGALGPVGAGVGIASGLLSLGSGIAGMFDDPGAEAGVLPQEFQIGLIQSVTSDLANIQAQIKQVQALSSTYTKQLDSLQKYSQGLLPKAELTKQLTQQQMDIAMAFGGNTADAVANGFLTPDQKKQLDDLQAANDKQFTDPNFENQRTEQRRQLQQDLARNGVGPAQQQIALAQFDRQSQEGRFNIGESMRQGYFQRGLQTFEAGLNARNQGFNQALTGYNVGRQQLGDIQGAVGFMGNLAGARYGAGVQGINDQNALQQQRLGMYGNLQQFMLSDETRAGVQGGLIGPGTGMQQLGVPIQQFGHLKDVRQTAENRRYQQEAQQRLASGGSLAQRRFIS